MNRIACIILSSILCVFLTKGAPHDIRFSQIGLREGLSHSTVNGIAQDRHGYLWVATPDGLNRYDGFRFSNFSPDSIDHNVRVVAADSEGRIWAATTSAISRFCDASGSFDSYLLPDGVHATGILPMEGNKTAVATDRGIFFLNPETGEFKQASYSGSQNISALAIADGHLLAGTSKGELIRFSGDTGTRLGPPVNSGINVIFSDKDGLLIGTEGKGLLRYDADRQNFAEVAPQIPDRYVRSLLNDSQGRLWVGTFTGLYVLDPERRDIVFHDNAAGHDGALSHSSVRRMIADNQGGIWLGTYYGGLNYYNPHLNQFSTLSDDDEGPYSLTGNIVGPLSETSNGEIWIGTNNGGLNIYNPATGLFKKLSSRNGLGSDDIKAIYLDEKNGRAYVGTHIGGLTEISIAGNSVSARRDVAQSVYSILPALEKGYLWLATLDGLTYFNTADASFHKADSKGLPRQTTGLMRDSKNRLWVSGEGGLAVFKEDGDRLTRLTDLPQLEMHVNATYQSKSSGAVWISTHRGLYRFDEATGTMRHYGVADGLPGDIIYAAAEDPNSNIWVSTNKGLACLNPDTDKIITYLNRHGLKNTQFSERSALSAHNGRLYFGGIDGLSYFNPSVLEKNTFLPLPVIEGVRIRNPEATAGDDEWLPSRTDASKGLTLESDRKNFTIYFTASDFISEGNNSFRYMLDGLDDQWITPPPGVRSVSYSSLPAGTYTFRLQTANNDGVWSDTEASLKIRILPPWFRTWWALAAFSILGIAAVALCVVYVLRRKMKEKQQKAQQEVTEMKVRFFVNLSHELRTPLTLMLLPINDLLASNPDPATRSKLTTVRNNTLRIQHIVDQLLDYRRAELGMLKLRIAETDLDTIMQDILEPYKAIAAKKHITFRYDSTTGGHPVAVDTNYIELIVNNLVTNAFKYTPDGGEVKVGVSVADATLRISVADTGCGIPADRLESIFTRFYQLDDSIGGYGIGLSLVKRLVELHHGSISVESSVGKGSVFAVEIPTDINAYSKTEKASASDEIRKSNSSPKEDIDLLLDMDEEKEITEENNDDSRKTLLVVDDNAEILKYLSTAFSPEFRVITAADGAKAIEVLGSETVDLIISDVMMPDVDGVQLCRAVKRNLRTSHIPLILLSAKADIADRLEAFKVGADDYIPKPFNMEELLAKVRNQIRTRENIIRHYSRENAPLEPSTVARNPLDEEFLKRAVKILDEHLDDSQFSTEEFARLMCMSRSNLHLKMKALTGEATNDFIRRTRLRKAAELLKTRRYTVAEVSAMVGYNTPSYFATSFKNFYGHSPSSLLSQP